MYERNKKVPKQVNTKKGRKKKMKLAVEWLQADVNLILNNKKCKQEIRKDK